MLVEFNHIFPILFSKKIFTYTYFFLIYMKYIYNNYTI